MVRAAGGEAPCPERGDDTGGVRAPDAPSCPTRGPGFTYVHLPPEGWAPRRGFPGEGAPRLRWGACEPQAGAGPPAWEKQRRARTVRASVHGARRRPAQLCPSRPTPRPRETGMPSSRVRPRARAWGAPAVCLGVSGSWPRPLAAGPVACPTDTRFPVWRLKSKATVPAGPLSPARRRPSPPVLTPVSSCAVCALSPREDAGQIGLGPPTRPRLTSKDPSPNKAPPRCGG